LIHHLLNSLKIEFSKTYIQGVRHRPLLVCR